MTAKKNAKSQGSKLSKKPMKPKAKKEAPAKKKPIAAKKAAAAKVPPPASKKAAPKNVPVKAPITAAPKSAVKAAAKNEPKTTSAKMSAAVQSVAKDLNAAKEKTLKAVVDKAKKMVKQAKEQMEKPAVLATVVDATESIEDCAPVAKPAKKRMTKTQTAAIEKLGKMTQKWMALYRRAKTIKSTPYSMRSTYEAKTAIEHKILGWGYILTNKNDRLEVLFKDGVKFLISNYK